MSFWLRILKGVFFNLVAVLALLAARASAKTITVEVGKSGGLNYSPDTIQSAVGDVVQFHFNAKHSVVAGDFKKPCTPVASGGFFSSFLPTGDTSTFSITVNNTDPVFFNYAVSTHYEDGMVGVINQGSDTLDSYRNAAAQVDSTVTPSAPFGGNMGGGSSSATSSMISSMSMSVSMTGSETGSTSVHSSTGASGSKSASGSPSLSPSSSNQPGAAENLNGAITVLLDLQSSLACLCFNARSFRSKIGYVGFEARV
ncbi:hypothetical protein TOPH_09264 [Tolypocladium ophioglossoides CBS 100239]|uniref:Extracellular serine-rich protein n=1 Tax=Tolypocladium ophioglossoides (strain CBS 100239) TaxID=1163406 RepID=A0A0L0MW20_TOLOC|nr:hypothetical protein TOPH_09264 [Tolypocladium ophioglossoides CBS 100239]